VKLGGCACTPQARMSSRRRTRSGGGATNRTNDVPTDMVEPPRARSGAALSKPERIPEGSDAGTPRYTPPRTLGER